MHFRTKQFLLIGIVLFLLVGCSNKESTSKAAESTLEETALKQGKLALANEETAKAEQNFKLAVEEDNSKEAKIYLRGLEKANQFVEEINQESFDKAQKTLEKLQQNTHADELSFITRDAEEELAEVMKQQAELDDMIKDLNTLYDPNDPDMVPSELYLSKSEELLELDYISPAQKQKVLTFQRAAKKKADEVMAQMNADMAAAEAEDLELSSSYGKYVNGRFGFSIMHPQSFVMGEAPTNDDGREFSDGNASITAFSNFNIDHLSPKSLFEYRKKEVTGNSLAYERLGDDWYVISYTEGSDIVYEKKILDKRVITTLIIRYPTKDQAKYGPVVEKVAGSMTRGRDQ